VHFGVILRANQQDLKTDFIFLNDTFGILGWLEDPTPGHRYLAVHVAWRESLAVDE
jgi:hypothetical protein